MTVNDEMVERAIAVAHQCGFVPGRSLVREMLEAAMPLSKDAVLTEAERAHVEECRRYHDLDLGFSLSGQRVLLAIIDRLTGAKS